MRRREKNNFAKQRGKDSYNCCEGRSEMASSGLKLVSLPSGIQNWKLSLEMGLRHDGALCYAKQAPEVDWPNHLLERHE